MKTWRVINLIVGHLLFGIPALLSLPALVATVARFGLLSTLTTALLPAAVVVTPWLLWLRYTRRRPTGRRGALAWLTLAAVVTAVILFSPLWFWTLPVLTLLLSESIRCLAHRPQASQAVAVPSRVRTTS